MNNQTSNRLKTVHLTQAAIIAALYIVLTFLANALGLANYVVQIRFSEALTILPYFTATAIPGLFIGCLLSNILTGCAIPDIIFGSIATLIGAIGAWIIGKAARNSRHETLFAILATLPNVIANTLIVPWVLKFAYGATEAVPFMMMTVGIGEFIASTLLGTIVILAFRKNFKMLK